MEIYSSMNNGNLIISLVGELDDHTANSARQSLDRIIDGATYKCIIFDLTKLSFMDSTGIGVLIGRYKKVKSSTQIFISNPSVIVDKIFLMSGLYDIMPRI